MKFELLVNRREMAESIGWLLWEAGYSDAIKRGERAGRVAISYRHPYVAFSDADFGHLYEAQATGHWPGEAVVAAAMLYQMRTSMPGSESVTIRYESGRLFIDDWAGIPCWWRLPRAYPPKLNPDIALLDLLHVRLTTNDVALAAEGRLKAVREAEERQRRLIDEASRILEPLGIGIWDLYRSAESAARWHGQEQESRDQKDARAVTAPNVSGPPAGSDGEKSR